MHPGTTESMTVATASAGRVLGCSRVEEVPMTTLLRAVLLSLVAASLLITSAAAVAIRSDKGLDAVVKEILDNRVFSDCMYAKGLSVDARIFLAV